MSFDKTLSDILNSQDDFVFIAMIIYSELVNISDKPGAGKEEMLQLTFYNVFIFLD